MSLFQSAPANYSGRIVVIGRNEPPAYGFNPRPPITAGESPPGRGPAPRHDVSIRARQLQRANHRTERTNEMLFTVSIRARQLQRANH